MDDRLKLATEHANYAKAIAAQRNLLLTQYQTDIIVAYNGGVFQCDPVLISFVDMLIRDGYEGMPIMTSNNFPVMVDDLESFKALIFLQYSNAIAAFNTGMQQLKKARSVAAATAV